MPDKIRPPSEKLGYLRGFSFLKLKLLEEWPKAKGMEVGDFESHKRLMIADQMKRG
ncbi:hypothetical protein AVEN_39841-1, partial [Araneus ventricosus]